MCKVFLVITIVLSLITNCYFAIINNNLNNNVILYHEQLEDENTFLYFAYGSNMLTERTHINMPSAVRKDIGKIENYQLDFGAFFPKWGGATATIVEKPGKNVWGTIWEINHKELASLDRQEEVLEGIYFRFKTNVITPTNTTVRCIVYQLVNSTATEIIEELPNERKPSPTYIDTIIRGAIESGLPEKYVQFLHRVPHNNYHGKIRVHLPSLSIR